MNNIFKQFNTTATTLYFTFFAGSVFANNAEKMLEKPTTKIEELAAAFGNIAPVASLIAIVLVGLAMQANYLPKKWAAMIIGGSCVVLIAGLIADFLYG